MKLNYFKIVRFPVLIFYVPMFREVSSKHKYINYY